MAGYEIITEAVGLFNGQTTDLLPSLFLLGVAVVASAAYLVRLKLKGRARSGRVDRQGGSALLSKQVMEGAYWFLQPFARLLVFFHVTPNQISWISLGLGGVAAVCLAFGHFGSGACFATISMLLDALDGIVARETGVASEAGEILDSSIDRYVEFLFLGGLVVYYREIPLLLVLTLFALMGSFMVSYSTAKAEALHIAPPKGSMRRPERALYLILGATLSPVTIPWLEVTRDYSVPIAHPMVIAICMVAVLANVSAVERLWAIARALRLREEDSARKKKELRGGSSAGRESESAGDSAPSLLPPH